jgi:ATP phosphoribosyltransferase
MTPLTDPETIRLALPKGRMQQGVFDLLGEAGISVRLGGRGYRPKLSIPDIDTKLLKPQNVIEMLHAGSRDVGFAGSDWVEELARMWSNCSTRSLTRCASLPPPRKHLRLMTAGAA